MRMLEGEEKIAWWRKLHYELRDMCVSPIIIRINELTMMR
jgi:hypothetical protein